MKLNYWNSILAIIVFLGTAVVSAQVTTSSLRGEVTDVDNFAVSDAEITAKHGPTGTVYTTSANEDGIFRISNMRVGGPYTVTILNPDGSEFVENNVFLQLGQTFNLAAKFSSKEIELESVEISVSTDGTFGRGRTGAESTFSREQLESLPNVTGGISDFVRVTPQARIEDDNVISIAGQNNRYNAIYVDGGVDNDVFGLSDNGLDGGGSGGNPFALDELDQITVSVAPYDVRQSGFAGGAINATTRAGTNELNGSAYYLLRNESLAGDTQQYNESAEMELNEFSAERYGLSLGGAIIKDKLFFFSTYEKERIETPAPFDLGTYIGQSEGNVSNLVNFLQSNFSYNPGTVGSVNETVEKDVWASRIDWNVNNRQTLSFKYKYIEFENIDASNSNTRTLNFSDRSVLRPNKKHQASVDWNANWSDRLSSKVLLTYKSVRDDRDPLGDFPSITIEDGSGEINLGSERFSTANNLEQDIWGLIGNLEYNAGDHNLLFGVQYDLYDITNVFLRDNYGRYFFNNNDATGQTGLDRFLAGELADEYNRTFSIISGDTSGDDNNGAAAAFNASQVAFYLQDEWRVDSDLTFTAGIRFDVPFYEDTRLNQELNDAIPTFEAAGYDLQGARTGSSINSVVHFSPRVGFNYTPEWFPEYKTQIRGGVGVFTSRIPLVWVGGAYNNTGNTLGFVEGENIAFNPDLQGLIEDPSNPGSFLTNNGLTNSASQPQIDIFAEDFRLPQRLKYSFGIDQKLPKDFGLTIDFQYDNVLNDVVYQNVNIAPVGRLDNGPDNRLVWDRRSELDSNFDRVLLGSNTSRGRAYTFNLGITNNSIKNLFLSWNYTYNDAYSVNNGTSSQNSSQWRNLPTINGKNVAEVGRSDYSLGSRFTGLVSYSINWAKGSQLNPRTRISAFYEGLAGSPYSYTYDDRGAILNDDSRENALIFVPNSIDQINLQDGYLEQTVQQQWDALNAFIENDSYLRTRRGQYVERNQNRQDWSHVIDLRILQEFELTVGNKKHTLGFSFDIFNFTNLLNNNWGRRFTDGPLFNGYNLIDVLNVTDNGDGTFTPEFGIDLAALNTDTINEIDNSGIQSSVWQMQFGIKYTF